MAKNTYFDDNSEEVKQIRANLPPTSAPGAAPRQYTRNQYNDPFAQAVADAQAGLHPSNQPGYNRAADQGNVTDSTDYRRLRRAIPQAPDLSQLETDKWNAGVGNWQVHDRGPRAKAEAERAGMATNQQNALQQRFDQQQASRQAAIMGAYNTAANTLLERQKMTNMADIASARDRAALAQQGLTATGYARGADLTHDVQKEQNANSLYGMNLNFELGKGQNATAAKNAESQRLRDRAAAAEAANNLRMRQIAEGMYPLDSMPNPNVMAESITGGYGPYSTPTPGAAAPVPTMPGVVPAAGSAPAATTTPAPGLDGIEASLAKMDEYRKQAAGAAASAPAAAPAVAAPTPAPTTASTPYAEKIKEERRLTSEKNKAIELDTAMKQIKAAAGPQVLRDIGGEDAEATLRRVVANMGYDNPAVLNQGDEQKRVLQNAYFLNNIPKTDWGVDEIQAANNYYLAPREERQGFLGGLGRTVGTGIEGFGIGGLTGGAIGAFGGPLGALGLGGAGALGGGLAGLGSGLYDSLTQEKVYDDQGNVRYIDLPDWVKANMEMRNRESLIAQQQALKEQALKAQRGY